MPNRSGVETPIIGGGRLPPKVARRPASRVVAASKVGELRKRCGHLKFSLNAPAISIRRKLLRDRQGLTPARTIGGTIAASRFLIREGQTVSRLPWSQYVVCGVASVGLLFPQSLFAAEGAPASAAAGKSATPALLDVRLGAEGTLVGQLLDGQGLAVSQAVVTLLARGDRAGPRDDQRGRPLWLSWSRRRRV